MTISKKLSKYTISILLLVLVWYLSYRVLPYYKSVSDFSSFKGGEIEYKRLLIKSETLSNDIEKISDFTPENNTINNYFRDLFSLKPNKYDTFFVDDKNGTMKIIHVKRSGAQDRHYISEERDRVRVSFYSK